MHIESYACDYIAQRSTGALESAELLYDFMNCDSALQLLNLYDYAFSPKDGPCTWCYII